MPIRVTSTHVDKYNTWSLVSDGFAVPAPGPVREPPCSALAGRQEDHSLCRDCDLRGNNIQLQSIISCRHQNSVERQNGVGASSSWADGLREMMWSRRPTPLPSSLSVAVSVSILALSVQLRRTPAD